MMKHGFLKFMRNKTLTELVRIIVTKMMPQLQARYRFDQFRESKYHRHRIGYELPSIFDCLPSDIAMEVWREQAKSAQIDLDDIEDCGNDTFLVPSTSGACDEKHTVNMIDGRCGCYINTEKGTICRHLFAVIDNFNETYDYDIESIDLNWFFDRYKINFDAVSEDGCQQAGSSNRNNNENSNSNSSESVCAIPLQLSDAKQNMKSAQTILSQLKTIKSLVYALNTQRDSYTNFRTSEEDLSIQKALNEYVIMFLL